MHSQSRCDTLNINILVQLYWSVCILHNEQYSDLETSGAGFVIDIVFPKIRFLKRYLSLGHELKCCLG